MKLTFQKLHALLAEAKKLPWLLASRAFLVIVVLILGALLIGGFLFYQYVILVATKQQDAVEKNVAFRYTTYAEILNHWQTRKDVLETSLNKKYLNPFIGINPPKTNE